MRTILPILLMTGALGAADYLPLQVGNQWVLESGAPLPEILNIEVHRSRTIGGERYFLVSGYAPGERWIRKGADGAVYALIESSGMEEKLAELRFGAARYETSLSGCRQTAQPVEPMPPDEGPGVSPLTLRYSAELCRDLLITQETYTPDLGLTQRSLTTFRGFQNFELVYARVNGKVFAGREKGLILHYDFGGGAKGWLAGFSDYSLETSDTRKEAEIRPLPEEISQRGSGFYLQSMNRSDDMFMHLKKLVSAADGLEPNRAYRLSFEIAFDSNAPSGCSGAGGAPGESVYLKAGASADEPVSALRAGTELTMNVDKGQQATGGRDAGVAGNIANGRTCEGANRLYARVVRQYTHAQPVRTDSRGELWLLVGTDSGFEGLTGLYFESITARLTPVEEAGR
jgi:hypothetical protein